MMLVSEANRLQSAAWHSAGASFASTHRQFSRAADYKSAIRQIENPHYIRHLPCGHYVGPSMR